MPLVWTRYPFQVFQQAMPIQKEVTHEDDETTETYAIKCSLRKICNDRRLVHSITSMTTYTTKVMYVGSLFLNYVFLELLNNGEDIPIIDHTFIYSAFALITGNGKKCTENIQNYFVHFCDQCKINETTLQSLKTIGYSSVLSIVCKQYETLIHNHVCENHKRRSTRYFLEALSDKSSQFFCKSLTVPQRKTLANYIYTLKESQPAKWPSSIEKTTFLEDVVTKMKVLWSGYQAMNYDPAILYIQPHMFFKWLFFLQQKTEEKFYIQEEVPATVASKPYVYRKLKELPFTATLNRKSFK